MLSWKIGDVSVTRIMEVELPGLQFILPKAIPKNILPIPWLFPHFATPEGDPIASIHALVVESQGKKIMVDTCLGNNKNLHIKFWSNRNGPFLEDLQTAGYARDDIDTVLCTHLHPDHVGWNTMLDSDTWIPTFPCAEYLFGRVEWEFWNTHRKSVSGNLYEESIQPIIDARLHALVETDHRITDEVWLEPTPGHTPGHVSVRIESQGNHGVITGDVLHHPCQMAHPEWKCTADHDPAEAQATRRAYLDNLADSPTLVIGTHFAAPTAGYVRRDGDTYWFELK